jgi:hypothetical protein
MKTTKLTRAGYRVHFDRLRELKSSTKAIRTHKFKCRIPKNAEEEVKKAFNEVSKVVDSSEEGSLLWFLTQFYSLGFCIARSPEYKRKIISALDTNYQSISANNLAKAFEKVKDEKKKNAVKSFEAFFDYLVKDKRGAAEQLLRFESKKTQTLPTYLQDLLVIFDCDGENYSENKVVCDLDEIIRKDLRVNGSQNFGLRLKNIFADFFELEELRVVKKEDETTFFYNPYFYAQNGFPDGKESEITQALFSNIFPTADLLTKEISLKDGEKELMGTANKQGGLSNFLNSSKGAIAIFKQGKEEAKEIIRAQNPLFFEKEEKLLDFLALKVYSLANKVEDAKKVDFIIENWYKYRQLVGGRLEGWVSNFQNRLEDFQESLKPEGQHQKVFEKIEAALDYENIFPRQIQEDFDNLKKMRPLVYDALNKEQERKSDQNLGKLLNEYNRYLKSFREFLIRWQEQGIPQKIANHDLVVWDGKGEKPNFFLDQKTFFPKKKEREEVDTDAKIICKWPSKLILKDLEKYPRFIGQAGKDPEEEIKNAKKDLIDYILAGFDLIRQLENKPENFKSEEESSEDWQAKYKNRKAKNHYLRSLESLKKIAANFNGHDLMMDFLLKFIDQEKMSQKQKENWQRKDFAWLYFFISGHEKRQYEQVPVKDLSYQEFTGEFEKYFQFDQIKDRDSALKFLNLGKNSKADKITILKAEIFKFWLSLKSKNLQEKVNLKSVKADEFLQNNSLSKLIYDEKGDLKKELPRETFQRFLQAGIGSEVRAKTGLLSRKSYVKRNVIQIEKGAQSWLRYVPHEWNDFDRFVKLDKNGEVDEKATKKLRQKIKKKSRNQGFSEKSRLALKANNIDLGNTNAEITAEIWKKAKGKISFTDFQKLAQVLGEIPHSFEMLLLTKKPFENMQPISDGFFIKKSSKKEVFNLERGVTKGYFGYALPIETSVVQKQFLEKFLWGDKEGSLTHKFLGSSIIIEQEQKIDWNNEEPIIKSGDLDFYWAIPFDFSKDSRQTAEEIKEKIYRDAKNILGIDLGEYGFGYSIFDPVKKEFIKSGFINIPLLKKMRDKAKSWRDTQAEGIFTRPTTYLAKIREQAAGEVRNQIHHLAIQHNAKPIYEDSVDGFESGGQRVEKLYKTLKTSDIITGKSNKADEGVRNHFWGSQYVQIGAVVGASYTSQTCRKCGRCAMKEVRTMDKTLKVIAGKIEDTDIKSSLKDGEYDQKEVLDAIKKAQRIKSGKSERGSVDQFVCQICASEEDADTQAASNIALKYFFKKYASEEDKEKHTNERKIVSTLSLFLDKSKQDKWKGMDLKIVAE